MIIADLKGKLTMQEQVSEDFLTSTVFSAFKYLDDEWITKFLSHAINIKEKNLEIKINNLEYKFWPNYTHENIYGGGCEPDLVLKIDDKAIIIEAKNYSGKSGEGVIFNEKDGGIKVLADQLGREYFVGRDKLANDFYLIYLTRDNVFPEKEIKESIQAISEIDGNEKNKAENRIFWLNWFKAKDIFEEILETHLEETFRYKISEDVIKFLEKRDIRAFKGFDFVNGEYGFDNISDNVFYHKTKKVFWTWDSSYIDFLQKLNFEDDKNIFYRNEEKNNDK